MPQDAIKANMGELKIGEGSEQLAAYGVGSCIIVVCYDRLRPVAAMLHGILPEKPHGKKEDNDNKYLDAGIENMVKAMIKEGVNIKDMEAKIFGGAKMFDIRNEAEAIGERNIKKAKECLASKGIRIAGEDIGGNYGRTIEFSVAEKQAVVKSFSAGTKTI
jgi:chemotaxis protein CheD